MGPSLQDAFHDPKRNGQREGRVACSGSGKACFQESTVSSQVGWKKEPGMGETVRGSQVSRRVGLWSGRRKSREAASAEGRAVEAAA